MAASTAVRDIMTTEVLTFRDDHDVRSAIEVLVDRDVDGAPVLDADGKVAGMLTTGDLIVRQSNLHFPTLISFLGASFEIKSRDFDEDLEKALGGHVGEVMSSPAITISVDGTVEEAATLMHDHRVSRLPVVDGDALVGIVSRTDVLRGALREA